MLRNKNSSLFTCILFAVNFLKEITLNVAAEYMINNNTLQQENPTLLSLYRTKNKIMGPSWKNYKITGHLMRSMCKKRCLSEPENKVIVGNQFYFQSMKKILDDLEKKK